LYHGGDPRYNSSDSSLSLHVAGLCALPIQALFYKHFPGWDMQPFVVVEFTFGVVSVGFNVN
jgi:hypothetical protein